MVTDDSFESSSSSSPTYPLMWFAAIIGDTEGARALGRVTEEHSQRNDKHADLLERERANVQGG
jgi:hypothetical protein